MHRIVASHLSSFIEEQALEADTEAVQFEKFVNYAILSQKISTPFDIEQVTTGNDDDGTDGIALIINEEHVLSDSDAIAVFQAERRKNDVEVVFIQAKTSDSFDLGDFLKFKESVLRFFTQNPYDVLCDTQRDARAAFDVAIHNVPKIRHGKPSVSVFYISTGIYAAPAALETAKNDMRVQLSSLGLF